MEKKDKIKAVIIGAILLIAGGFAEASIRIAFEKKDEKAEVTITSDFSITLSEEQKPAIVENAEGELEEVSAPTVEEIDGNQVLAPEGDLPDLGQGAYYDVSSPQAFRDATYGKCIDMDGYYGSQCVDLYAAFQLSYANRWPDVCGTGAARGLWDCRDRNAGEEYELVLNASDLQAGDWVVFGGGQYGHVGMALGPENGGYVALLGENQGGSSCYGGGSATNIINMSTKTFLGAFRPKAYIVPKEPKEEPVIPISGCGDWNVVKGDTMSGIMLTCEGVIVYGEPMNQYADSWKSQKVLDGKSVYWGWTHGSGYGLYAGDYLLHDLEGR